MGVALGHGVGARGVEREGVAVDDTLQVSADVVGVVCSAALHAHIGRIVHGLQHQQRLPLGDVAPGRCQQRTHAARVWGQQHMFHLHGFEHGQLGAGSDHVAPGHAQLHEAGGHGGQHGALGCRHR